VPPGPRKKQGRTPVARTIAFVAASISAATCPAGSRVSIGWFCVWLAITWPSATIRRASAGWASTLLPITKNVARTP
jgi:hypothetical protein